MKKKWDTKNDVWAFGITMWEIFSFGITPYPAWDNVKTIQELKRGYRMPMPDYNFSKEEIANALYNVSYLKYFFLDFISSLFHPDYVNVLEQGTDDATNILDHPHGLC